MSVFLFLKMFKTESKFTKDKKKKKKKKMQKMFFVSEITAYEYVAMNCLH